ncbi:MAG: MFS transporter [Deltaproteobacteria bacterium]|nr:MFS transporter [Deltaproteobacteria bacterium]MBW1871785.1 MFS transporter [Deltaproteobacteria bacterium]
MANESISKWVARASGVRASEWRRTLLAAFFYFFFVAHVVMVKSAANSLFLSRHNPQHLPYLYILVAVLVALIVVFASKTLADPRKRFLRLVSLSGVAVILIVSWVLLRFDLLPISPFLYLFGEVSITALNLQFWSVAGDIFDPQEGKRVFGILAGGGMSGSIFGGLFVQYAGVPIGTVNLLLVAAGVLFVCVFLAQRLARHPGRADDLPASQHLSLRDGFKYVVKDNYPRTFGILLLLSAVITSFVDFFFRTSARSFLGEDQLTVLFGELNFYVGVISVVFLFLFSGRILRRMGIFNYLLIVPVGMVMAASGSIFFLGFTAVYILKIIENSGSLSINQAGLQLLYNPVPTALRAPARGVIDGFLRKMGYAVGGGILLLVAPFIGHPAFEFVIMGMVVLFVALLLRLRVLYIRTLDEKIRVGARGPASLRLEDASTHQVLVQTLDSQDDDLVETAVSLLSGISSIDLRPHLQKLIKSKSEKVRLAVIETIAERRYMDFLFDLLGIINSGDRRERVAAVRAVVALDPNRAGGALGPYLKSDDPGLVAVAIEAMIQMQGYSASNPAIGVLENILERGSQGTPGVRRETARLLGRLGEGRYTGHLAAYLADPDPSVCRIAAKSTSYLYREEFVPLLLHMLLDRETRPEAREALAAFGDKVIDLFKEWLNDRERPLNVRLLLPRIIRMIGTQRAGEVLLFSNIQDDASLRHRIALAISSMRLQNPNIKFDRKWALQAVDRRLDSYRYYDLIYRRLACYLPPGSLAIKVLMERLNQNIEVAFRVLGLIYPHRTIMNIFYRLKGARGEAWSDAIELLDNIVDRDIRLRFFPILEDHKNLVKISPAMPWDSTLPEIHERLEELSDSKDLLLRAATIHTRCLLGEDCEDRYPELAKGKDTMNIMEIVLFLESVNIFKENNLDDLTALAAITKEKTFAKGEHILRMGEPGDALYIITKGKADITNQGKRILSIGEKGSLGSVSLLDQKPHAADVIACEHCEVLVIDRIDFLDLVADRVELLHGIFLALTERLRALLAVTDEGALAEEEYDDGPTNPV